MVILGHYIKIGPHRSKLLGTGRRILDDEGFFIRVTQIMPSLIMVFWKRE